MDSTFGGVLKDWRAQRRMSQLDLALAADVSARHISFLETGRAKPSRSMILRLSETLEMPRGARNTLLNAAGYAPAYRTRDLDSDDMAHVRAAVEWTLDRHDPFPAMALDRHWVLVRLNRSASMLFAGLGLNVGDSLLDAFTQSDAVRSAVVNWPEVARHATARLRTESAHLGGDEILDNAADKLATAIGEDGPVETNVLPAVIPARYQAGGLSLSLFSTIAQFGSAEDIALADLKIELMFPADEPTREILFAAAGQAS